MAVLFSIKCGYSSINLHRNEELDSLPIGKNSKLNSLMTEIYSKRQPSPEIIQLFKWLVFKRGFVNEMVIPETSNAFSFQELAMLLALATACRSSKNCLLNVNYMVRKTITAFFCNKLTKTWWKGKPISSLHFSDFPENLKFYVAKTLDH